MTRTSANILIEGYTPGELLSLPQPDLDALVLGPHPVTFTCGSAELLGRFQISGSRLLVELGHVDAGGEGVLLLLWNLVTAFARMRGMREVEWSVHAVHCSQPNMKLRRVLTRRGFSVTTASSGADIYRLIWPL